MALLDFFLSRKKSTASVAKERLQIIVAERRRGDSEPHYLPDLKRDILAVICKYIQIDPKCCTCNSSRKGTIFRYLNLT